MPPDVRKARWGGGEGQGQENAGDTRSAEKTGASLQDMFPFPAGEWAVPPGASPEGLRLPRRIYLSGQGCFFRTVLPGAI